jgi:hypothetical protein
MRAFRRVNTEGLGGGGMQGLRRGLRRGGGLAQMDERGLAMSVFGRVNTEALGGGSAGIAQRAQERKRASTNR